MLQILIIMIALGALGILMFVALPPDYKWGRDTEDNVDAPTDNAFWTQLKPVAGGNNGPTQITVAPPYIILGVPLGLGQQVSGEGQIRIYIQTMSGSYSEYVASRQSAPVTMPVLYVGSVGPATLGRTQSELVVWE